jgi:ketosteroid isomerase-like protein
VSAGRLRPVEMGPNSESQENLDKARDFIEAYNARDFDRATANFDRDIEWVLPPDQAFDSARGIPGVLRFFEGIDETMGELQLRPQEYVEEGDLVATRLRHYGRGKGSGAEIDTELYHQVATFRDGVIVRMEYVTTWEQALELLEAQRVSAEQTRQV